MARSARTKRLSFCISPKDSLPCLGLDSRGGQEVAPELAVLRHDGVASTKGVSAGHKVSLSPRVQVRPGIPNRGQKKPLVQAGRGPALLWLSAGRPRGHGCFCSAAAEEARPAARGPGHPPSRTLRLPRARRFGPDRAAGRRGRSAGRATAPSCPESTPSSSTDQQQRCPPPTGHTRPPGNSERSGRLPGVTQPQRSRADAARSPRASFPDTLR